MGNAPSNRPRRWYGQHEDDGAESFYGGASPVISDSSVCCSAAQMPELDYLETLSVLDRPALCMRPGCHRPSQADTNYCSSPCQQLDVAEVLPSVLNERQQQSPATAGVDEAHAGVAGLSDTGASFAARGFGTRQWAPVSAPCAPLASPCAANVVDVQAKLEDASKQVATLESMWSAAEIRCKTAEKSERAMQEKLRAMQAVEAAREAKWQAQVFRAGQKRKHEAVIANNAIALACWTEWRRVALAGAGVGSPAELHSQLRDLELQLEERRREMTTMQQAHLDTEASWRGHFSRANQKRRLQAARYVNALTLACWSSWRHVTTISSKDRQIERLQLTLRSPSLRSLECSVPEDDAFAQMTLTPAVKRPLSPFSSEDTKATSSPASDDAKETFAEDRKSTCFMDESSIMFDEERDFTEWDPTCDELGRDDTVCDLDDIAAGLVLRAAFGPQVPGSTPCAPSKGLVRNVLPRAAGTF